MTEPRTPDDQPIEPGTATPVDAAAPAEDPPSSAADATGTPAPSTLAESDSPTQAWPSLAGPSAPSGEEPSARTSVPEEPTTPPTNAADEAVAPLTIAAGAAAAASTPGPIQSPFEPAPSLPPAHVATVGEGGTFGAAPPAVHRRSRLRWGLALLGVLIVAAVSFLIVSLVGGRPATSTAMSYMPADAVVYTELRIDLPGDQRQKLASFLAAFPSFKDQSAIEPKIDELFDRVVRKATEDKQTWTADIKPWFGGQVGLGVGLPENVGAMTAATADTSLAVFTITDRAKATAWLTSTLESATINRSTYGDADLFVPAAGGDAWAIGINDKVMVAGSTAAVKAAIDTSGKSAFNQNDDVKAALATVDKDFVMFSVVRTRAYADQALRLMAISQPGVLEKTQIDETALAMIPAWQVSTARFENDSIVGSTAGPAWAIGYDTTNRPSDVLGHVPAKTLLYADIHDAGPALGAIIAKFRALDETKPAFAQFDQTINILGGPDAVYGWWGDTAVVVSALADGTIGGGLVIHPRDAAAADRLLTTLAGFVALGGGGSGIATRTEDHNGTKITIIDLSGMPGASTAGLPPGYKAEFAWATKADVTVLGYGASFVAAVLDAGPGNSLADDARFKGLLGRVGADNMGIAFLDIAAIRALVEPLVQTQAPADKWTYYTTEIQPYLKPLDAVISAIRKDGGLDRGTGAFTAH
jgi:Protein of unknown function (DUF3352)